MNSDIQEWPADKFKGKRVRICRPIDYRGLEGLVTAVGTQVVVVELGKAGRTVFSIEDIEIIEDDYAEI